MKFYVYILHDPRPGKNLQPIYIGKGKGRRAQLHWYYGSNHYNRLLRSVLNKIREANLEPLVEIVGYFETEAEAFNHEVELIAQHGRRNLGRGTLCNLTDGGEGATGNLLRSQLLSERMRKRWATDPEFAKAITERARKTICKLNADPEFVKAGKERASNLMRKLNTDPEFRKRQRQSLLKLHADPEFAKARNERMRKRHTDPEFKKAHAERMRIRNADPEFQARARAARWGRRLQDIRR